MGIPTYAPNIEYTISPPNYIPLYVCTLLIAIASGVHGAFSVQRGQARSATSRFRSVIATSSHHHLRLAEL